MMNHFRHIMLVCALGFAFASDGFSQPAFQNLSFESAHNLPVGYTMPTADALPGWTWFHGTNQNPVGVVCYNTFSLSGGFVCLLSRTNPNVAIPSGLLNGQFCVMLQSGFTGPGPSDYSNPTSIAQTGQLPSDAKSIRFRGTVPLSVSFAGNEIPLVVVTPHPSYNFYGGDISQFAGQTGELRIASYDFFSFLDLISFSSQPIPEPGNILLVVLVLGLCYCRWAIRSHKQFR